MIRIAYVVHGFHAGGLERCVARLVDGLDRTKFQPFVLCLDTSGAAAEWIQSRDVPILELRKGRGNGLRVLNRLAAALRRHEIDIAHSHNWGTLIETSIACRLAWPRVRHLHAERGTVLGEVAAAGRRFRMRAAATRLGVRFADAALSNSMATRRRVAEIAGRPDSSIHLIPNGVDAPLHATERELERAQIRAGLGIDAGDVVFGTVGRLAPVKDLTTAVRAIAFTSRRGIPVRLVIVGNGPERERIAEAAADEGVADRVHLVGHQPQVGPWLAAMDAYFNTSVSEGMSQSVVEAMAMRLPLVVTDVGDHRRLVEGGGCGRVVPVGNAAAIGEAFFELGRERSLRENLGSRAAAAHAEGHSLQAMIARYEQLYLSLVPCHRDVRNHSGRAHRPSPNTQLVNSR